MKTFYSIAVLLLCWSCQNDTHQVADITTDPQSPHVLADDYEQEKYKWGFAKKSGELVIPDRYDEVRPFTPEGFALVREDGRWNFIDIKGRPISQASWKLAWSFKSGFARVQSEEDLIGYLN
ncbi:MAG: WG repeat-containing protein [Bacteroidota bacterium]